MGDLYMSEEEFRSVCSQYTTTIMDDGDISNSFWIVYDLLKAEADALEAKEPWATATIDRLRSAAHEVMMMEFDVTDAFEEVMER